MRTTIVYSRKEHSYKGVFKEVYIYIYTILSALKLCFESLINNKFYGHVSILWEQTLCKMIIYLFSMVLLILFKYINKS